MRLAYTALASLLAASAIPSVCFAQIVVPYTPEAANHVGRLDHPVPVATVTRPGDAIVLTDPRPGDGFVLGAATLDLKDPDRPMVGFTMTNGTQTPLSLRTVMIDEVRVNARPTTGALAMACSRGGPLRNQRRADAPLQPGASVSVEMPIAPLCGPSAGDTVGFVVYLESGPGPYWYSSRAGFYAQKALLRRAFEQLRSEAPR